MKHFAEVDREESRDVTLFVVNFVWAYALCEERAGRRRKAREWDNKLINPLEFRTKHIIH
jgi:hypothetical protein